MAQSGYDFAVFGSTVFARLLAGLLAGVHGKRVCLVGERWSPYRLPRRIDVSVAPISRPATWALLQREVPEALKVFGGIGRGLYERVDPLFVAETPETIAFLGHMRWMALGFGFAAEPAVDQTITSAGRICRIRDAARLVNARAAPAFDAWLDKIGIGWLQPGDTALSLKRDGSASITTGTLTVEAETVILADDEAILDRMSPSDRHRLIAVSEATALMIEPVAALPASLITYLDRETAVLQRNARSPVTAIASGDPNTAVARLAASIPTRETLRQTGQTIFRTIVTADGAPLIGRMGRGRAMVIAGLGPVAAFLAPAVAQVVVDQAPTEVADYFAGREPSRGASRGDVAELPARVEEPAT